MLPASLPQPLHPTYPLYISTVSCKLNQTVIDNTQIISTALSLAAGPFTTSIPALALNSLSHSNAHYISIAAVDTSMTSVNNSEQQLDNFESVLIVEARREISQSGEFFSYNQERGIVYEGEAKILITISSVTGTVGPLARYDEDTKWWRIRNITESSTHDPTNGVYSFKLPKYGKYAFLTQNSPLVVPVDLAVTNTNFIYFFSNIELVRSEYSSEEIITLLSNYFFRVRNLSLQQASNGLSIQSKSKLEQLITQTLTGICIILPDCQIDQTQTGLFNTFLSVSLIDQISELLGLISSAFLTLPSDINLPTDSSFLDSQYSSFMIALLQFMKEYEHFFTDSQILELNLIRAGAVQGCSQFLAVGEHRFNSDSSFVKVSAYKGNGDQDMYFQNTEIASRPAVLIPSTIYDGQEISFVVIFKKPSKQMQNFSIIGNQLIQIKAYSETGERLEFQGLEEGKRITISIYDYGIKSCEDLQMRFWDSQSSEFLSEGINNLESSIPLCSFETSHLSQFAIGVQMGNSTVITQTVINQTTIMNQLDSSPSDIYLISTLLIYSLIILTISIYEDIKKCKRNKTQDGILAQGVKPDRLPPSFCRRWCILICQLNSFLSFFTARRRFFLVSTQGLILLFRLWLIASLVSAAFLTSQPAVLISIFYLIFFFIRPLGIFILNLKFTIIFESKNNRIDPIESAVISEQALASPSKGLATSTHRLHVQESTEPESVAVQKNDDKSSESSDAAKASESDLPKEKKIRPPNLAEMIESQNFDSVGAPQPRSCPVLFQVKKNQILEKAVFLPLLSLSLIAFIVIFSRIVEDSELIQKQVGFSWMIYISLVFLLEPLLFLVGVQLIGKQILRRRTKVAYFLIQMILGPKNLVLLSQRLS